MPCKYLVDTHHLCTHTYLTAPQGWCHHALPLQRCLLPSRARALLLHSLCSFRCLTSHATTNCDNDGRRVLLSVSHVSQLYQSFEQDPFTGVVVRFLSACVYLLLCTTLHTAVLGLGPLIALTICALVEHRSGCQCTRLLLHVLGEHLRMWCSSTHMGGQELCTWRTVRLQICFRLSHIVAGIWQGVAAEGRPAAWAVGCSLLPIIAVS